MRWAWVALWAVAAVMYLATDATNWAIAMWAILILMALSRGRS